MDQIRILRLKEELREELKNRVKAIDKAEKEKKSNIISTSLFSRTEWEGAELVCTYLSLKSEVQTAKIIQEAIACRKMVAVPRIDGMGLTFYDFSDPDIELVRNPFNILEPISEKKTIDFEKIEGRIIVIVPALGYDKNKNRLGRGKGFYDRLIYQWQGTWNFTFVGLAFAEQIVEEIPVDNHDQPVDLILTDKEIIS